MKSDVVQIYSDLTGRREAMSSAEKFIQYHNFTGKNAMHIRLLTEELISMIHGIMDKCEGNLWFESENTKDGILCHICLSADKEVDPEQEEQLLSVSSSGKNEDAKGILGKIRESFRISTQYSANEMYMNEYMTANSWYGMGIYCEPDMDVQCWSLRSYQNYLSENKEQSKEEWDELEKSIIAKLADEVKVWLKFTKTEVVIDKLIKV